MYLVSLANSKGASDDKQLRSVMERRSA